MLTYSAMRDMFSGGDRQPIGADTSGFDPDAQTGARGFDPYTQAGARGVGRYEKGLEPMADPTEFLKKIMSDYHESPFAQYQQERGMQNVRGEAARMGMRGSGPLMGALQEQGQKISSADMHQYLQDVLGIQSTYLGGEHDLAGMGLQAEQGASAERASIRAAEESRRRSDQQRKDAFWQDIAKGVGAGVGFITK